MGSFSGGQRAPAGHQGPSAGTSQPPDRGGPPCPRLHPPAGRPRVFFPARCSVILFSQSHAPPVAPRFEIQAPAGCLRPGVPPPHLPLGAARGDTRPAPWARQPWLLEAACVVCGVALSRGWGGWTRACLCAESVLVGGRRVGKGVILTVERGPWAVGGEKEKRHRSSC